MSHLALRERQHGAARSLRRVSLFMALLMVVASFGYLLPQAAAAPPGAAIFQVGNVNDGTVGTQSGGFLTFPYEIEEGPGGPPGGGPAPEINASMTATISNVAIFAGGTANDGLIGGDAMEFDVTITNSPTSNAMLTAWAFQSKFSESPALGSRIGDKAFFATLEAGGVNGQMASVKKNGTSNGLFTGKWKGICINSSLDFIPEFNSGLDDESLECAGNRADTNADGEPELQAGANMLGLAPGESQTVRIRIESGTTDGALHVVQPGTLRGGVQGTPFVGPNGLTYFVPTINNTGITDPNVLAIPDFADNKVLRNADGTFNPTFAPAADGLTFAGQQYLTLPRRNFAFSDLLGRNHSCGTYGLDQLAGLPCSGNPGAQPFINLLGTGDLVPGVQNFAAILQGFGEFYDPNNDLVPDVNPGGEFPGDTRPNYPYNVLCENCGGRAYVPIAEFYQDTGTIDGDGNPVLIRQIVGGSFGAPGTAGQYTSTISTAAADDIKEEIIPEPDPGGPCLQPNPNKPACARLGTAALGEFYDLAVVPGGGINGGDAIEFSIEIQNNSSNPNAYLTAFNYQTKRRGLADIGVLDGFSQDRRDIRLDSSLPACTAANIDAGACWDATLGVGHFPNVIGNGLLFGQMVWTDANAGREPDPVDSDQVFVNPATGINPTPFWLESVKKNGPFSPILQGNTNFICVKSGLFDLDPDADAACAGQPAILADPDGELVPANITQRLGLPPGQFQRVRVRMEFGDFRGAMLQIVAGTLTAANVDTRYTATNGLARFFDCSDQRELEFCHPSLVGTNIGYLPNTNANWLTPQTLEEIEYVIINQPGDAPTVMNFQQNFGQILAMAGFVPSAEFYAPDPNPELVGTPFEGVLIRQQVLGDYTVSATPATLIAPEIFSAPVTAATSGQPYAYQVVATGNPDPTLSLSGAPSGMSITAGGLIRWATPSAGIYNITVNATSSAGSDSQSFTLTVTSTVLDNFNRGNGRVGANWTGATKATEYAINGNRVDVGTGGPLYYARKAFGASQEASLKLSTIDPKGTHHTLMLKVQNRDWGKGAILVTYDATLGAVYVQSRPPNAGWTAHAGWLVTVKSGDTLTAQAMADGTVRVLVNGTVVGSTPVNSYFKNRGGSIGLWFMNSGGAWIDDFGGGTIGN